MADTHSEREKKSLVGIAEESFYKVLNITEEVLSYYNVIMIDFNSLISLFSYKFVLKDIEEKEFDTPELILTLTEVFKTVFLTKYMYRQVIFFYKEYNDVEPVLRRVHPNWRVNLDKNENSKVFKAIRNHFITLIERMSSAAKNIQIIKVKEKEHTYLPLELTYQNIIPAFQKILVISRDPMCMLNCTSTNIAYFNGDILYSYDRVVKQSGEKIKLENIHPAKLPLVFLMSGIKKLGYKGMSKMGVINTVKFCIKNNINTAEDVLTCEELKSVHKFIPIFFFEKYISFLESQEVKDDEIPKRTN